MLYSNRTRRERSLGPNAEDSCAQVGGHFYRLQSSIIFCVAFALLYAARPRPARADVTDDQILATIKQQVDYLLAQKKVDNWEPDQKYYGQFYVHGGQTSMVLYALLYAGRCIDDERLKFKSPELKPVVQWVSQLAPTYTYAASMQINGLAQIPNVMKLPEYRVALSRAAQLLVDNDSPEGTYSYTWDFRIVHRPLWHNGNNAPDGDNSNGQYGLLGVWIAQDVGFEVPLNYWAPVHAHWTKSQHADGGWGYTKQQNNSSLNMTAAGLASLYITTDCVDLSPPRLVGVPSPAIDNGLSWMEKNFEARNDAYGLYGCERVGLASGLKYFGAQLVSGSAAAIIAGQNNDGSSNLNVDGKVNNIPNTAYALLFLCRGRNPVLFNKLEYHDPTDPKPIIWNARPRDLANLTHQYSKNFEKDFNWHVVNLQVPVEEWLDSPVLLITGSRDPHFTPQDIAKLKTFVDDGGLIFSTADGGMPEFTEAMKKYAAQICDGQYEMRELPNDHYIYNLQYTVPNPLPPMLGLSNGIRELWIHSPTDLGAFWQMRRTFAPRRLGHPRQYLSLCHRQGGFPRKIPKPRRRPRHRRNLPYHQPRPCQLRRQLGPRTRRLARMAKLAAARFNTDLEITTVKVADLDPHKTPIAHMTGTTGFSLDTDDVAALRKYLEGGGTLLVDAGGGSDTFNSSFTKLATELFPKDQLADLPVSSPVITGQMPDGVNASSVDFRRILLKKSGQPPLQVIEHNGRNVIYYSSLDLTSGLLGTNTWGIKGYSPDSAQAVLRDMLLCAAQPAAKLETSQR